jgi:hypothetical protein
MTLPPGEWSTANSTPENGNGLLKKRYGRLKKMGIMLIMDEERKPHKEKRA